jgi:site-specific recombinase XerD
MAALALSYFGSPQFNALRSSSQYVYRRTIERFGKDHGDKRAADLRRDHVVKLMSRLAEKPHAANTLRRALRNLMRHAIDIGLRADDPTRDVKAIRIKSTGHHSWTDAEIAQFERCHPVGSRARLALALLLYTGQRRSDVIRMGAQHVRGGVLTLSKTRPALSSPYRCIQISRPLLPRRQAAI